MFPLGTFVCFCFPPGCKSVPGANGSVHNISFNITISSVCIFAAISQQVYSELHIYTLAFVFPHVITVNQLFVHGSSHKTREKEHCYASGAPH